MKKILLIDDSALMRRNVSDIIEKTKDYKVSYYAVGYQDALEALEKHNDIFFVICSSYINSFNLEKLYKAASSMRSDVRFLVWGSLNPVNNCKGELKNHMSFIGPYTRVSVFCKNFEYELVNELEKSDANTKASQNSRKIDNKPFQEKDNFTQNIKTSNKLVAIVCSTGGPKALQSVITKLPANLAAPVLIVQHMPKNFTKGLADRLNSESEVTVKEAENNEKIIPGVCYIAPGGVHLEYLRNQNDNTVIYSDKPAVLGLKPYGNIMFESLCGAKYEEIVCVVLTGMGNDGTEGIKKLSMKNKIFVIAQNEETSTVYGMPKAIYEKGIVDVVCGIDDVAGNIIKKVGVI
ncbi:MAG: chemotaxis protein CheB [Lachnospiraceae bacterium]|nr:chemotaxis protein CheB [Lachnospiraceae bacterium]